MSRFAGTRHPLWESFLHALPYSETMATPSKTPPGADPKQLERTGTVREIGSQAVWSLSSCKPGRFPTYVVGAVFNMTALKIVWGDLMCFQVSEWINWGMTTWRLTGSRMDHNLISSTYSSGNITFCFVSTVVFDYSYSLFCPVMAIWHNSGIILSKMSVAATLILPDLFISIAQLWPMYFLLTCRRRTTVKMLCIYADYKSDESYTPSKISVRVGNNFHNLQEIRVTSLSNI